jgi:pimeloyl-ACP methyl ester carboxylesterase
MWTASGSPWARPCCWKVCGQNPGFVRLWQSPRFSRFRNIAYDRERYFAQAGRFGLERIVGRTIGLLPAEIALFYARWRYGVDLRKANPVDALKSSTIPVLLIHGEEDINILPEHSRIRAQADPAHAQLWLVAGAGHCGAASVAPREFWSRVFGFFAQHAEISGGKE